MPPLKKAVLLSRKCTLGIGGEATYFSKARSFDELKSLLLFAKETSLPFFLLGHGSNCLFDDRGYEGLIIQNRIDFLERASSFLFRVGAGYSFSKLGLQTASEGLGGLEFAAGIPGTVGGALFMNASANGASLCTSLLSCEFMDETGHIITMKKEDCHFGYRTSIFQKLKGAIVSATFQLSPFQEALKNQKELLEKRKKTQPLKERSAGCVFKNPIGAPAGALIEELGFKGYKRGAIQVSPLHANFLVNTGDGSSRDFLSLVEEIKKAAKAKKEIDLECEIRYLPFGGKR